MLQRPNSFIGTAIADQYSVHGLLGEGGFAWVFRAENASQKTVAVKVLHSSNTTALARFRREIEVLKALPLNPHVPQYFDDGVTDGGQPFLVLEYIEGRSLARAMKKRGAFQPKDAVKIVVDLCQALVGLHQLGVAHRDLKPENAMLAHQGLIKLIDFGLVRDAQGILQLLEQESHHDQTPVFSMDIDRLKVAGTPEYMAPEQFSDAFETSHGSARTDTWSDVFSLGVILYELIAKNVPFPIEHDPDNVDFTKKLVRYIRWRLSITDDKIPKCKAMDAALESIVHKTLRRDPRQRQANAQMLKNNLQQYLRTGRGISRSYGARTVNMQLSTGEFLKQTSGLRIDPESETTGVASPEDQRSTPPPSEIYTDDPDSMERGPDDIARPIIIISETSKNANEEPLETRGGDRKHIDSETENSPLEGHRGRSPDRHDTATDDVETGDSMRRTLLDLPPVRHGEYPDDETDDHDDSETRQTHESNGSSLEIQGPDGSDPENEPS